MTCTATRATSRGRRRSARRRPSRSLSCCAPSGMCHTAHPASPRQRVPLPMLFQLSSILTKTLCLFLHCDPGPICLASVDDLRPVWMAVQDLLDERRNPPAECRVGAYNVMCACLEHHFDRLAMLRFGVSGRLSSSIVRHHYNLLEIVGDTSTHFPLCLAWLDFASFVCMRRVLQGDPEPPVPGAAPAAARADAAHARQQAYRAVYGTPSAACRITPTLSFWS